MDELTTTTTVSCSCCGEMVEASYAGFSATTAYVAACSAQRAAGIVSWTVTRSGLMAMEARAAAKEAVLRHKDGLVTFG